MAFHFRPKQMTANFLLQLRVGGKSLSSVSSLVLGPASPLCAILLGNDYSSRKNQQPPSTFRLFRPSVEIRWPTMLTSYIICIFFVFSSDIIFPLPRTTDHHYADLCTVSDPGRPSSSTSGCLPGTLLPL